MLPSPLRTKRLVLNWTGVGETRTPCFSAEDGASASQEKSVRVLTWQCRFSPASPKTCSLFFEGHLVQPLQLILSSTKLASSGPCVYSPYMHDAAVIQPLRELIERLLPIDGLPPLVQRQPLRVQHKVGIRIVSGPPLLSKPGRDSRSARPTFCKK